MLSKLTANKMALGAVVGIVGGLIVAVLLVVVGGVGRSTPASAEGSHAPAAAATAKAPAKTVPGKETVDTRFGPTYVIKDRIVNLADPGGRRYLRFSVAIQFQPLTAAHAGGPAAGGFQLMDYLPELDGGAARDQLIAEGGSGKDPDKEFQPLIKPY